MFNWQVIAQRKAEWKLKRDGNYNEPTNKKQALLDLLLEMSHNGTVLSDEDIREEVNTFMYAGHDTLATSISWTLYALGRHPEYQVKEKKKEQREIYLYPLTFSPRHFILTILIEI